MTSPRSGRSLRKALLVARVGAAAVAGAVVRGIRRIAKRPPRIWHGMHPLHIVRDAVRADRSAGYSSRSVVRSSRFVSYAMLRDEDFDRVASGPGVAWDEWNWICLEDLLLRGDVWVAFFECLFFRPDQQRANEALFWMLKMVGVRIVVAPHGGDIVHAHRYRSRFDWIGRMQEDYPDWDLTAERARAESRIGLFCRHARLVISADSSLRRLLPRADVDFKFFPVDTDGLRPSAPADSVRPRIVHAPNHRKTKGTQALLDACESLRARGIEFELDLVEGVPRHEAFERYGRADIIADQFVIGAYGVFALEGLALGKPVLTYLDQEHLGDPVFNLPLVNANPENLEAVLAALLRVPALRERLGAAGRSAVERYHSPEAMGEVWDRIYRHVWWDEPLALETTAHFSPERTPRSFTEDPSRAEFWPVPVADLLGEIQAALTDPVERSRLGRCS